MIIYRKIILCGLWLCSFMALAQRDVKESVYLHLSSADLIVGETLHFSGFVQSKATGKISPLSELLYVELLDSEGTSMFKTKIQLTNGRGAGKYFIPSLTKTGVYHLTAYTRWMRNWEDYFHTSIHVTNPYEEVRRPSKEGELSVEFHPLSGSLVADVDNELGIYIHQNQIPQRVRGRLVAEGEDGAIAVQTNVHGWAKVNFTPSLGTSYQLIVEGPSGLKFYNIPAPCTSCAGLRWSNEGSDHVFEKQAGEDFRGGQVQLVIQSSQEKVYSQPWNDDAALQLSESSLPNGMLLAQLVRGTETVAQRLFWNGRTPRTTTAGKIQEQYGRRQQVALTYDVPENSSVSVSVKLNQNGMLPVTPMASHSVTDPLQRRVDIREVSNSNLELLLATSSWNNEPILSDSVRLLPEFRTDLLEGWITDFEGRPQPNLSVGLSIPSKPYQLRIIQSENDGSFIVDHNSNIRIDRGVFDIFESTEEEIAPESSSTVGTRSDLQPPNSSVTSIDVRNKYRLHLLEEYYAKYPGDLPSTQMQFDSSRVNAIIQRSVFNQLENAYFVTAPDTITSEYPQISGFKSYVLDNYTRFPTIRDTFIEFVPWIGVSKNENNFDIDLRADIDYSMRDLGSETIMMIDGVLVDSKALLTISPYLVQRIDVLPQKYFFQDQIFDGIISFHTFGGDAWDAPSKDRQIVLSPTQPRIRSEESPAPNDPRHADYRTLLSWQPVRTTSADGLNVSFQTSDVPGTYRVEVNGITPEGDPISITQEFEVVGPTEN